MTGATVAQATVAQAMAAQATEAHTIPDTLEIVTVNVLKIF